MANQDGKTELTNAKSAPVTWAKVVQSEGDGFNPKTGIFRARFDGIYSFAITALTAQIPGKHKNS